MDTPIDSRRCNLHRDLGLWLWRDYRRQAGRGATCRNFGALTSRLCDNHNNVDNACDRITIPLPIYELRNWGILLTQGRNDARDKGMSYLILQGKRFSPVLWVSWQTTLTALLTIWLLACLGCAQSPPDAREQPPTDVASEAQSEYEQETIDEAAQEAYEEEEEVLLVRYYPPPRDLPKAQIVSSGSVSAVVDGDLVSAEWDFISATPTLVAGREPPFIWPEATVIDSSNSVVRFLTDVKPGLVFVEGIPRVESRRQRHSHRRGY